MCGICGFTGTAGADMPLLRRMTDAMAHRGPDDAGFWFDGTTGLGARRLAILDPAHSQQPLSSEDGQIQVVLNGEIYNYADLRAWLQARGHRLRTQGDGEVIAHLYEDMGMDLIHHLRGMFAFALFDRQSGTLHLARDRFGIKPLFLADTDDGGLAFASDIRSILASGLRDAAVDGASLWQFLTFQYIPGPETLFARIRRLLPGHYLTVRGGAVSDTAYWKPVFAPDDGLNTATATDRIRDALETSVRLHLQSDVPVGAFLSSGVDSSAVVALMRQHGPVHTFSVAFEDAMPGTDERTGAGIVARALRTDHHEVSVSARDYADAWPDIVASMEDPVADPAAPGIYFLAQEARHYVRVILSGEGADELFGGYPIYRQPGDLRAASGLPAPLRRALRRWALSLPAERPGRGFLERATTPLERRYLGGARLLDTEAKMKLLGGWATRCTVPPDAFEKAAPWYAGTEHLDPPTRMQACDLAGWLAGDILVKADKMSMAHSIEIRVPYLDPAVWEVARTLPTRLKITRHHTKMALRRAVEDLLPDGAAWRPKLGFPVPLRTWLRGPLRDFVEDVARTGWPDGWLDRDAYRMLLAANAAGTQDASRTIYAITTFLLWHQTFVRRGGSTCSHEAAEAGAIAH